MWYTTSGERSNMRNWFHRLTGLLARWADEAAGAPSPATFTGVTHR